MPERKIQGPYHVSKYQKEEWGNIMYEIVAADENGGLIPLNPRLRYRHAQSAYRRSAKLNQAWQEEKNEEKVGV